MWNFGTRTEEQRAEALQLAKQAKIDKAITRQSNKHNLKLEYLDSNYWATLATKFKIRLPNAEEAVDAKCIRKYLKRCGITFEQFNDHYTNIDYFLKNNPKWTKYAAAGLILELKEQQMH